MTASDEIPDEEALDEVKNFVLSEVEDIFLESEDYKRPCSPEEAVELLFRILHHRVGDKDLDDTGPNVLKALQGYRTNNDLGNLADRCEPFIKFIAKIIDSDSYKILLDKKKDGILSFGDLLLHLNLADSRLLNAEDVDSLIGRPRFAKHVGRTYLTRNNVHEAPKWTRKEKATRGESLLVFLTFAVMDHYEAIGFGLLVHNARDALEKLSRKFAKWNPNYVELDGEEAQSEEFDCFEPMVSEVLLGDEEDDNQGDDLDEEDEEAEEHLDEDEPEEDETTGRPRKERVLDLIDTVPRLLLVGDPGAGKTTTLQYLAGHAADRLLKPSASASPLPVYVELKNISPDRTLESKLLEDPVAAATSDCMDDLLKGNHILLLDGWNEVRSECKEATQRDISHLLDKGVDARIVITSRPGAFPSIFQLPQFILQTLSDQQIKDFLRKRFPSDADADKFFDLLCRNPRLLNWGRNPLCLEMISRVGLSGDGKLPENIGLLYQNFIRLLMKREKVQNLEQTPREIKERLLAHLAFETRWNGKVAFTFDEAIPLLRDALQRLGAQNDVPSFISEVIDNNLLVKPEPDKLSFAHEMYQEYFAAYEIFLRVGDEPDLLTTLTGSTWNEPLVLYSGLTEDRDAFIRQLTQRSTLLAAKCVSSSSAQEPKLQEMVAVEAKKQTKSDQPEEQAEGFLSLVELGDYRRFIEALRETKRALRKEHKVAIESAVEQGSAEQVADMLIAFLPLMKMRERGLLWLVDALPPTLPLEGECRTRLVESLRKCQPMVRPVLLSKIVFCFGLTAEFPAKPILDALLANGGPYAKKCVVDLVVQHDLQDQYPVEEIVRSMLGGGKQSIMAAVELIENYDLQIQYPVKFLHEQFPVEKIVGKLLLVGTSSATKVAIALIKEHDLHEQFPVEKIVGTLLLEGKSSAAIKVAIALIEEHDLHEQFPVEKIVGTLLLVGKSSAAIKLAIALIVEHDLHEQFPVEKIVGTLLLVGKSSAGIKVAERLMLQHDLQEQYLIIALVKSLLAQKGYVAYIAIQKAVKLIEKHNLQDDFFSTAPFKAEQLANSAGRKMVAQILANKRWKLIVKLVLGQQYGFGYSLEFPDGVFFNITSIHSEREIRMGNEISAVVAVKFDKKREEWSYSVRSGHLLSKDTAPSSLSSDSNSSTLMQRLPLDGLEIKD